MLTIRQLRQQMLRCVSSGALCGLKETVCNPSCCLQVMRNTYHCLKPASSHNLAQAEVLAAAIGRPDSYAGVAEQTATFLIPRSAGESHVVAEQQQQQQQQQQQAVGRQGLSAAGDVLAQVEGTSGLGEGHGEAGWQPARQSGRKGAAAKDAADKERSK